MSIFTEIRALLALGLTGNELKTALVYLVEKDEASREVRGKDQDELRGVAGLSRSRFAEATATLIEMGLIETTRHRQSAQTITVRNPQNVDVRKTEMSTKRDIPEMRIEMSAKQGLRHPGNADMPKGVGSKSAPESSARDRANDDFPANVIPVTNWRTALAPQIDDPDHGVVVASDGTVSLVNGMRSDWLDRFGGDAESLDLALMQIHVQRNSQISLTVQVNKQLAAKVAATRNQDKRYQAAVASNAAQREKPKPVKLSRW